MSFPSGPYEQRQHSLKSLPFRAKSLRLKRSSKPYVIQRSKSLSNICDLNSTLSWSLSSLSIKTSSDDRRTREATKTTTNRIAIPKTGLVAGTKPVSPRYLLMTKKFSLPVYMTSHYTKCAASSSSMATAANTPLAVVASQIAMSSSTKFSTSEAETIVMANNQSGNLRNSFYQQLSYSPTIVNTGGNFIKIINHSNSIL